MTTEAPPATPMSPRRERSAPRSASRRRRPPPAAARRPWRNDGSPPPPRRGRGRGAPRAFSLPAAIVVAAACGFLLVVAARRAPVAAAAAEASSSARTESIGRDGDGDGEAATPAMMMDLEAGRHRGAFCVDGRRRLDLHGLPASDCSAEPGSLFVDGGAANGFREGGLASVTGPAKLLGVDRQDHDHDGGLQKHGDDGADEEPLGLCEQTDKSAKEEIDEEGFGGLDDEEDHDAYPEGERYDTMRAVYGDVAGDEVERGEDGSAREGNYDEESYEHDDEIDRNELEQGEEEDEEDGYEDYDEEDEYDQEDEYDEEDKYDLDEKAVAAGRGHVPDYAAMTVDEMWTHAFQCDDVFRRGERPVHGEATWAFLRGVYLGVAGRRAGGSMMAAAPASPLGTGFRKVVSARQTPDGKGRGVYAAEPIRRGELVWSATMFTARFSSGSAYREFLSLLPPDLACDVLQWAYVQELTTDDHASNDPDSVKRSPNEALPAQHAGKALRVSVDLDEGSYMNGEDDDPNVGCLANDRERLSGEGLSCQHHFFALRDIHEGQELLCSYGTFAKSDGWSEFGL